MRITHRLQRGLAGALAASLACVMLGACSNDSDGGSGKNAAEVEVPVPSGASEVPLPSGFPDRVPTPKAPHVLLQAEGEDPAWILMAAYAEDVDLDEEFDHFRETLEEKGFKIEEEQDFRDVEEVPDTRQASLLSSDDEGSMNVVFFHTKGEQPLVQVTTWGDEVMGEGE